MHVTLCFKQPKMFSRNHNPSPFLLMKSLALTKVGYLFIVIFHKDGSTYPFY
jgi:hypothetical protein